MSACLIWLLEAPCGRHGALSVQGPGLPIFPPQARGRPRREDVRVAVANIYRVLADSLIPGSLRELKGDALKLIDFLLDTLRFLNSASTGQPPS
jgi:hypothetical protein